MGAAFEGRFSWLEGGGGEVERVVPVVVGLFGIVLQSNATTRLRV